MISVPAMRLRQFGVTLYQALLGARDVDRLVRFEVLGYQTGTPSAAAKRAKKGKGPRVNWELLEKRIAESPEAYQRPVIRKKIGELVEYYMQCADTGNLPAIPGAVLLVADRRLEFTPTSTHRVLGVLQIPAQEGVLRALDGQHRLLALHQMIADGRGEDVQVPAVLFDGLAPDQVVELFVTINAKHTKLNPSHLISLALSGSGARRGTRHHPRPERARRLAAPGRDQALRRRARPRRAGAARRGAEADLHRARRARRRAVGALPRGRATLLPQLFQAGRGGVPEGVGRPEVQYQDGDRATRVPARRARRPARGPRRVERFRRRARDRARPRAVERARRGRTVRD
jgi:DGQHR domain-containing protein